MEPGPGIITGTRCPANNLVQARLLCYAFQHIFNTTCADLISRFQIIMGDHDGTYFNSE